jgi:hypothetical protein
MFNNQDYYNLFAIHTLKIKSVVPHSFTEAKLDYTFEVPAAATSEEVEATRAFVRGFVEGFIQQLPALGGQNG